MPGEGEFTDYDLEGLVLRSGDPEGSASAFVEMGFASGDDVTTVNAGEYRLHLVQGTQVKRLRVCSFISAASLTRPRPTASRPRSRDSISRTSSRGRTLLAVFVRGPEDVSVEYIEHKPTFSLT